MTGGKPRHPRGRAGAGAPLAAALACVALGACGGSGGDSEPRSGADSSPAPVEETVKRLARIVADAREPDDCEPLQPIQRRASVSLTCPGDRRLRRSMAKLQVTGVEIHGTAAVVDYTSGALEDGGSVVFLRDPEGRWGIARFGLVYERTVGTSDEDVRPAFDATVDAYLRAVRDRDCDLYRKHAGLDSVDVRTVCERDFARTAPLARALKANPDARPAYLGGNGAFGFYGLSFDDPRPRYTTLFVARSAPGSLRPAAVVVAEPGPPPRDDLQLSSL